jgi:hypothetical protein
MCARMLAIIPFAFGASEDIQLVDGPEVELKGVMH